MQLHTYSEMTAWPVKFPPGTPSHRCDECGRDLHVWPSPKQLAWPRPGGGDECSDCRASRKAREAAADGGHTDGAGTNGDAYIVSV